MTSVEPIDLPQRRGWKRPLTLWIVPVLLAAFLVLAHSDRLGRQGPVQPTSDRPAGGSSPEARELAQLAAPSLLRPLSPDEALQINSRRAIDQRPDKPASPFVIPAGNPAFGRALRCLADAIYYEAGSEPADGQRAVAQVILNRVRHAAFPPSVCGTVYQGSDRVTGCQFTFSCDGSRGRLPSPAIWSRAEKIAREALAGKVFGPVGHATHYHADYVVPYWADSMDKSIQIGRHIFYRMQGGLGAASAFGRHYAGIEPAPISIAALPVSELGADLSVDGDAENSAKPVDPIRGTGSSQAPLTADLSRGILVADDALPSAGTSRLIPDCRSGSLAGEAKQADTPDECR